MPGLYYRFETQKAQVVGYRASFLAYPFTHLFLREVTFVDELLKRRGHFYRVEVAALDIFYQRHFQHLLVVGKAYVSRDMRQARQFGSAETAFAGDQLE